LKSEDGTIAITIPIIINMENLKSLKYYLLFCVAALGIYIYAMENGWRWMSYNESSHAKERNSHSSYNHK